MTRNQLKQSTATKYETSPIFTVDCKGNVLPTAAQSIARNSEFLIHSADPAAASQYEGYVCAWRNGACQCSALVSNLDGEPHMMISSSTSYIIASTAPAGDYTLYTTTTETGSGPTPAASVGDIHLGNT